MTTPRSRKSWHQRSKLVGASRRALRAALFELLERLGRTDDGRAIAAETLEGLLAWRPTLPPGGERPPPYPELGRARVAERPSQRADPIFITARFRSGSTLLWSLFRQLAGCTAYYEPLNPRRWFDPATRGTRVDPTHHNVADYWREYDGLELLGRHHRSAWAERNLFMDADSWDPDLTRYIELLIERAPGRPVLQFNRIDFRLAWVRRNFPHVRIVHLYRHPRDQWCSSLLDPTRFPRDGHPAAFEPYDHFYLRSWARDLKYHFPFLDERAVAHPYELFYYLWKLSYLFGVRYAHYSLTFERLVEQPDTQLAELFEALDVEGYDLGALKALIVKPSLGRWEEYADDAWFKRHEAHCETVLAEFLGAEPAGRGGAATRRRGEGRRGD